MKKTVELKVVILGAPQTGKSTFMASLCNENINENMEYEKTVYDSRLGIDLIFQFTDNEEYLKDAICGLLMYDITKKHTVDYIKMNCHPLMNCEMDSGLSFQYLLGNKFDLDSHRQISFQEGQEFSTSNGLLFTEITSLKESKKNLELVAKMLAMRSSQILKNNPQLLNILMTTNLNSLHSSYNSKRRFEESHQSLNSNRPPLNQLEEELQKQSLNLNIRKPPNHRNRNEGLSHSKSTGRDHLSSFSQRRQFEGEMSTHLSEGGYPPQLPPRDSQIEIEEDDAIRTHNSTLEDRIMLKKEYDEKINYRRNTFQSQESMGSQNGNKSSDEEPRPQKIPPAQHKHNLSNQMCTATFGKFKHGEETKENVHVLQITKDKIQEEESELMFNSKDILQECSNEYEDNLIIQKMDTIQEESHSNQSTHQLLPTNNSFRRRNSQKSNPYQHESSIRSGRSLRSTQKDSPSNSKEFSIRKNNESKRNEEEERDITPNFDDSSRNFRKIQLRDVDTLEELENPLGAARKRHLMEEVQTMMKSREKDGQEDRCRKSTDSLEFKQQKNESEIPKKKEIVDSMNDKDYLFMKEIGTLSEIAPFTSPQMERNSLNECGIFVSPFSNNHKPRYSQEESPQIPSLLNNQEVSFANNVQHQDPYASSTPPEPKALFKSKSTMNLGSDIKDRESIHSQRWMTPKAEGDARSDLNIRSSRDFIDRLDEDIKRTEESIRKMNERFEQRHTPSPMRASTKGLEKRESSTSSLTPSRSGYINKGQNQIPVFQANLQKPSPSYLQKNDNFPPQTDRPYKTTDHSNPTVSKGFFSSRQSVDQSAENEPEIISVNLNQPESGIIRENPKNIYHEKSFPMFTQNSGAQERLDRFNQLKKREEFLQPLDSHSPPLLYLRIKLSEERYVNMRVTKNDTPSYLAEKCMGMEGLEADRGTLKKLAEIIQTEVNKKIEECVKTAKIERMRNLKNKFLQEKNLREKKMQEIKPFDLSTQKRIQEKENRPKIIGRLNVLIGNNKKGDIIIREGDNPANLVKSFMISYSLKKEIMPSIMDAINQLIQNHYQSQNNPTSNTASSQILTTSNSQLNQSEDVINQTSPPSKYKSLQQQSSLKSLPISNTLRDNEAEKPKGIINETNLSNLNQFQTNRSPNQNYNDPTMDYIKNIPLSSSKKSLGSCKNSTSSQKEENRSQSRTPRKIVSQAKQASPSSNKLENQPSLKQLEKSSNTSSMTNFNLNNFKAKGQETRNLHSKSPSRASGLSGLETNSCYSAYSNQTNATGGSRGNQSSGRKKKKRPLLFRMNFDFGNGRSAKIYVREGDNLYRLAYNFVVTYKLGDKMIDKVWNLLEHTFKVNECIKKKLILST